MAHIVQGGWRLPPCTGALSQAPGPFAGSGLLQSCDSCCSWRCRAASNFASRCAAHAWHLSASATPSASPLPPLDAMPDVVRGDGRHSASSSASLFCCSFFRMSSSRLSFSAWYCKSLSTMLLPDSAFAWCLRGLGLDRRKVMSCCRTSHVPTSSSDSSSGKI